MPGSRGGGTQGLINPIDDLGGWGSGGEDLGDAGVLQLWNVCVRNDSSTEHGDVATLLVDQLDHAWEKCHMGPGETGQPDRIDVLLYGGRSDLLGSLMESRVNDLYAGISKGASHHLYASVMAVQSRLRDQYAWP